MFKANLDVINLNDYLSSMYMMTVMLVNTQPMPEVVDAYAIAGGGGTMVSIAFFFSFWVFAILVVFSVFVSFVVDGFVVISQAEEEAREVGKWKGGGGSGAGMGGRREGEAGGGAHI